MDITILIMFLVLAGFVFFWFWDFINQGSSSEAQIHKEDVVTSQAVNKQLKELTTTAENGILAPSFDGVDFFVRTSDRAIVLGPPGTGKTSFLINQIYRWAESGRSLVCLDVKPELYSITRERLEKNGYKCIVYNPTKVVNTYDFLQDLNSPEMIGELASSLIPSENADNAVFNESAKDLLEAIISHFSARRNKDDRRSTLVDVVDFMNNNSSFQELYNNLQHSKSPQTKAIMNRLKLISSNERLLGSVLATFNAQLRFMLYENVRKSLSGVNGVDDKAFSLSALLEPKTALFLQFEESEKMVTGHLFSVFVGHLLRYLISNTDRDAVFCLLDEIGNAGVISGLTEKLNTIRSRNMPTWMYWQSREQMQKYGGTADEGVNTIMGACDFQMCFRLNDISTSEWFSKRVGTHLVASVSHTGSYDPENKYTDSDTTSYQREEVLFPHDFQRLKDGEVIAIYKGVAWKGKATPYWALDWEKWDNREKIAAELAEKRKREAEEAAKPSELEIKLNEFLDKSKAVSKDVAFKVADKSLDGIEIGAVKAFDFYLKSKEKLDEYSEKKAQKRANTQLNEREPTVKESFKWLFDSAKNLFKKKGNKRD